MRFDDMIATVLDRPSGRPDQRAAQWRQLVDLLAQHRGGESAQTAAAYDFLRAHRAEVSLGVRSKAAAALAGLPVSRSLIQFFAEDHPIPAGALLRGARLSANEWLQLLPALSPTGRAILRHRRDLPTAVETGLERFGPTDFVLGDDSIAAAVETPVEAPEPVPAQPAAIAAFPDAPTAEPTPRSQILELVDRIEQFQKNRETGDHDQQAMPADAFRWETGPEGVILWVEGAPRGALIGQSIAVIGEHGQHGVDGQAAGAFQKRTPFRDARFSVAGEGAASGDWRISGVPCFDPARGHFLGYRGTSRRPRIDEVAATPAEAAPLGVFGTDLAPDALRQLIHELRTPLNAIVGFAEMIEGQYMGPAGAGHRGRAHEIVSQAQRLLGAVDDLDTAARIETSGLDLGHESVDAGALLHRLHGAYAREAEHREARLEVIIGSALPRANVDANAIERMYSRLLAATIGLADSGETIAARLDTALLGGAPIVLLAIDRPAAVEGQDEASMLQPGYTPEGDWPAAPALGLGFALRLVRKLAEAAGGSLMVEPRRFVLSLPAVSADAIPPAGEETTG